jgi:hypothetical protein
MMIAILLVPAMLVISLLQETNADAGFDDLGTLLLGGVAAAIVVAVAFSFVRLKLRGNNPPKSDFITIGATNDKE